MSQQPPQLSEEELRALEAELERITVDDVLLQTVVSLINLGARRAALGAPPEAGIQPDWPQVRTAIDAARALLPILEPRHADKLSPVRDALSHLQIEFARHAGGAGAGGEAPGGTPGESGAAGGQAGGEARPGAGQAARGPAQRSGRLWVPGQ